MTSRYPHFESEGVLSALPSGRTKKARVLIVGGGFAGVSAYRALQSHRARVERVVISDNESFVHVPLIHEVATGALPANLVHWPLSRYIDCPTNEFLHARVLSVDADKRSVHIELPDGGHETHTYDYLVLAVGSCPSVAHIPGAEKNAFLLRTLSDAEKLKEHIVGCFKEAEKINDPLEKQTWLSFAVIGAGATGLELVGELSNLFTNELRTMYPGCCASARIMLINNKERITIGARTWVCEEAEKRVNTLPLVAILHDTHVSEIKKDGFVTDAGFTPARTVIWTGGVAAVHIPISAQPPVSRDEQNRVVVEQNLTLSNHPELFVAGDEAHIPKDGGSYGMQAQFAVRGGKHVANNIIRALNNKPLLPFRTRESGFLLPIGKHFGIAEVFGFQFKGFLAWHLAHIIYVFSVVGWGLKCEVAWKWLYHLMRRRKTV